MKKKEWYYGLEVIRRPYKRSIRNISIIMIIIGFIFFFIPFINPLTMTLTAIKLLNKFG